MTNDRFDGPDVKFDPEKHVQKAHRYEYHFCGHCPNIHIIFYDHNDFAFCDATFTADQLVKLAMVTAGITKSN